MNIVKYLTIVVWAIALCSCGLRRSTPEWKDQPLIFPAHPKMSSAFVSVEDDGHTMTLTADLGTSENSSETGMRKIDIDRLASVCVVTEGRQDMRVGPVDVDKTPTHLYAAFSARAEKPGRVSLGVYKGHRLAEGLLKVLEPGKEWKRYRLIVRVRQPVQDITLRIQTDATVEINDFGALCKIPVEETDK